MRQGLRGTLKAGFSPASSGSTGPDPDYLTTVCAGFWFRFASERARVRKILSRKIPDFLNCFGKLSSSSRLTQPFSFKALSRAT